MFLMGKEAIKVISNCIFACNMVVAKTYFRKSDCHLITFKRGNHSETNFILIRGWGTTLYKDRNYQEKPLLYSVSY